jgi:hypothetical protein
MSFLDMKMFSMFTIVNCIMLFGSSFFNKTNNIDKLLWLFIIVWIVHTLVVTEFALKVDENHSVDDSFHLLKQF